MRQGEGGLAATVLDDARSELVISDGPLTYFASGPLVGMVKRQTRPYLDAERARILPRLAVGERSPLFHVGERSLERYCWYLRLAAGRVIDSAIAGIVRLEVAARDGVDRALEIAELTCAALPRFATPSGRDPRAPQQLYPVAARETALRRRLGDAMLIRRAIEVQLLEEVTHA
jgi:hypothetical protein